MPRRAVAAVFKTYGNAEYTTFVSMAMIVDEAEEKARSIAELKTILSHILHHMMWEKNPSPCKDAERPCSSSFGGG